MTASRVYPVSSTGRYHWPLSDQSSGGLFSRCGRTRLDADRGLSPNEVAWSEQCYHPACRREYDLPDVEAARKGSRL